MKEKNTEKKAYEAPRLYVYGDLKVITQTGANMGIALDAGMADKTS
jgi:hypothetical protein